MRRFRPASLFPVLLAFGLVVATACKKDKAEDPQPTSTGELKYTYLGVNYIVTDAREVSALYEASSNRVLISASPAGKPGVNFGLTNVTAGGSSRTFLKGSVVDNRPSVATLTRYDNPASLKPIFSTLYGPSSTNGTMTITSYDLNAGKLSGTFTFTGGPTASTGATGTAVVTNGTFSFTSITRL